MTLKISPKVVSGATAEPSFSPKIIKSRLKTHPRKKLEKIAQDVQEIARVVYDLAARDHEPESSTVRSYYHARQSTPTWTCAGALKQDHEKISSVVPVSGDTGVLVPSEYNLL